MRRAMIWVDHAILAIVGISALISLLRGFVREALSLAGWILAFWLARAFTEDVSALLAEHISVPSLRQWVAALALFAGGLLATGLVVYAVGLVVEKTGLSGTDRMLGMVFGVARGAVIVELLVLAAGLTALPNDPWWRESLLLPHFEQFAIDIRALLPAQMAERISYPPS